MMPITDFLHSCENLSGDDFNMKCASKGTVMKSKQKNTPQSWEKSSIFSRTLVLRPLTKEIA